MFFSFLVLNHIGAITLGVGASTIAVAGFLTALADGTFDPSERRIMGVVYISLRVAMVTILVTSALIFFMRPDYFGAFTMPMWIMTAVLFINAILMTKHWISPKFGPAIQAATWYTLGFLMTIYLFDLFPLTPLVVIAFFLADFAITIATINICLMIVKRKRGNATPGKPS